MAPQGLASFPGLDHILTCEYSFTHGVTPSSAHLTCTPQTNWDGKSGDLTFSYGGESVTVVGMAVSDAAIELNPSGQRILRVTLLDRRWKWAFGQIDGWYNRRGNDGQIIEQSRQRPRDLVAMLLDELEESNYTVGDMPDDVFPEVSWDVASPAHELQQLCDLFGFVVVLGLDDNVTVVRLGFGGDLPTSQDINDSGEVDPPESPEAVTIVGAPHVYQTDFVLEAVGLDVDNTIQPIDVLSYAPEGRWDSIGEDELDAFMYMLKTDPAVDLDKAAEEERARQLALQTVYRWYRIMIFDGYGLIPARQNFGFGPNAFAPQAPGFNPRIIDAQYNGFADGHNVIPQYGPIQRLEQILPLSDYQVETLITNDPFHPFQSKPAEVFGVWWDRVSEPPGNEGISENIMAAPLPYDQSQHSIFPRNFTIDKERGIFIFPEAMIKLSNTSNWSYDAADLFARIAVNVRDADTMGLYRYERSRNVSDSNTPDKIIHRPDIVVAHTATYSQMAPTCQVASAVNNSDLANAAADKILDDEVSFIEQVRRPQTKTYPGLVRIDTDGAIQQVTYRISETMETTASLNTMHAAPLPIQFDFQRVIDMGVRQTQQLSDARNLETLLKRIRIPNA